MDVRFIKSQTSFKSGRLSPKLYNRIDTNQYKDGASVIEGFRVLPEGGAEAIKGKRWVNSSLFNAGVSFDESKTFSIQTNGVQRVITLTINGFNEVSLRMDRYPYDYNDAVSIVLVPAGPNRYLPSLYDYAFADNQLTLVHHSGELAPFQIKFTDDGEIFGQRFLDVTNSTFGIASFPQGEFQSSTITIGSNNVANKTVEITSTDPTVVAFLQGSHTIYGEGIRNVQNSDNLNFYSFVAANYYKVTGNIANGVTATYQYGFFGPHTGVQGRDPLTGDVNTWSGTAWRDGDYPKTVTYHEGRIVFGGSRTRPMTLFASQVDRTDWLLQRRIASSNSSVFSMNADYEGSITPTDAYVFTVASSTAAEIVNLQATSDLFIGTDRKEYIATGGDTVLSALSVQIKPFTSQGGYPCKSMTIDNGVLYTSGNRKKLFIFKYNHANGSFVSQELSLLFNDLMEDDYIQDLEWAPHIKSILISTGSGKLYGITYDPDNETVAFYNTLELGVKSIAYVGAREDVSSSDSFHIGDHVYMYTTAGVFTYEQIYFEKGVAESYVKLDRVDENEYMYLDNVFDMVRTGANAYSVHGQAIGTAEDKFFIPNSAPYKAPPYRVTNLDTGDVVTINTLTLAPTEPDVFGYLDHPDLNGASRVVIGNPPFYEKVLATMPIEAGQQFGPAQLGIKNIDELGIRFYKSYSYKISGNGVDWQEVRVADKLGNANTGREETKFQASHKYDFIVWIKLDKPEPLTITGINMRGVSNDG